MIAEPVHAGGGEGGGGKISGQATLEKQDTPGSSRAQKRQQSTNYVTFITHIESIINSINTDVTTTLAGKIVTFIVGNIVFVVTLVDDPKPAEEMWGAG